MRAVFTTQNRSLGVGMVAIAVLAMLSGCNYQRFKNQAPSPLVKESPDAPEPGGEPEPREVLEPTFSSIEKFILTPLCVDCHQGPSPAGAVDLSSYVGVMDVVEPENPDDSGLYYMVVDDDMPKAGTGYRPLTEKEKETIAEWIRAGAQDD